MHKDPEKKPQSGARKLIIDGETWWYYITRAALSVPIWSPERVKTVHRGDDITHERAITPFHLRIFIDRKLRKRPESEIKAFIAKREERIQKERDEFIESLRKSVYERAKIIVEHSNDRYMEYHGGDEIDIKNRDENKKFLDDLLRIICYDATKE